jgi:hypothetical protein
LVFLPSNLVLFKKPRKYIKEMHPRIKTIIFFWRRVGATKTTFRGDVNPPNIL